jgi:hypothetical protein
MNRDVLAKEVSWSLKASSALSVWAALTAQITTTMTNPNAAPTGARNLTVKLIFT